MKNGLLGFTRREILWFATFFIISVSLMVISTYRLIRKYYNYSIESSEFIKKNTHNLWAIQDMSHFAVNIQRGSLNLIIYNNNPKELENVKSTIIKNVDSLNLKFVKFEKENLVDVDAAKNIVSYGRNYLEVNGKFVAHANDSIDGQSPEIYNVNVMRPTLRKFTDLIRQTSKDITLEIEKKSDSGLNLFSQAEFWILGFMLLPYFYFFFRFLYLVLKLIMRDFKS
ncbi:MAG: hypothetical protein ACXVC6_11950 [Bacteroidia bacterium]